jgi:hypothetical protein
VCVEVRGGICKYIFFNPIACCFLYKAKDLSATTFNNMWQTKQNI